MAYLIGTDEAGYGPNLGPLLVGISVWRVPDDAWQECLYQRLRELFTSDPRDRQRMVIADSKKLFKPPGGFARLQHAVHAALAQLRGMPETWHDLWRLACPESADSMSHIPWYKNYAGSNLAQANVSELAPRIETWKTQTQSVGVELIELRAAAVFAHELNRGIRETGNKSTVLSITTLDLISQALRNLPPQATRIVCDKHGGRNYYAGLLQSRFAGNLVRVVCEGPEESSYSMGTAKCPVEITFRVGGESFLPSALASMLAKYLREQAMEAFNAYWCEQIPGLNRTAGYPLDAKRFKAQIHDRQRELGIDDDLIWRNR